MQRLPFRRLQILDDPEVIHPGAQDDGSDRIRYTFLETEQITSFYRNSYTRFFKKVFRMTPFIFRL